MAQKPLRRGERAAARDPKGFEAFPDLPPGDRQRLDQWLETVRIQPLSATEWQVSDRWALGPRRVNDSMWFWFECGHGWGRVGAGSRRFEIRPGDLMLIPQGAEHTIRQAPGVAMHLITVHFYPRLFGGINLLDLLGFPPHVPGNSGAPFGGASQRLAREYALKAPGWRAAMGAGIRSVLWHLVRYHGRRFRAPGVRAAHADLPRLLPALEWLDARLDDPALRVGDLAKRLFVSEVQFRKLFRRVTGMSPVRFIQRRRIERACVRLRESEASIEQVAADCGFSDTPFFYRVFKAWVHMPPGRYRRGERL